ncbi:MAG: glycosyltransferase, partial [Planctomycetota bacterium]
VLTSDQDAARLASRHPGLATAVVESGFDPAYFQPQIAARAHDELLFLGSLDYAPNIEGLHWFVREVLPAVAARHAGVRLRVVGRAPAPEVLSLAGPRVSIVGGVDDVRPELARTSVLVVPLRIGGGTRVKIVEAMGCETPIVSTRIGAEGLAFRDPEHLALADRAQDFAARVCEVLGDPQQAGLRAQQGRKLALERYTWSELAEKLLAAWSRAVRG